MLLERLDQNINMMNEDVGLTIQTMTVHTLCKLSEFIPTLNFEDLSLVLVSPVLVRSILTHFGQLRTKFDLGESYAIRSDISSPKESSDESCSFE